MDEEQGSNMHNKPKTTHHSNNPIKVLVVLLNCLLMSIGQVGGPILARLYYLNGGKKKWLNSWLLTSGFPILILPMALSYARTQATSRKSRLVVTPWLFTASAFLGLLLGFDAYLYSFGLSYLPVSISSLLGSTQIAFTAIFAFVIVKHKFTHYSINAVVLMTFGSIVLGLHMNGDRPDGVTDRKYALGFCINLTAAALHGFLMPSLEYTFLKSGINITIDLVMQVQFIISMFATVFCTVPMIINKDFQGIAREAEEFGLGKTKYFLIIVLAAIANQCSVIGSIGVIFGSSSLLGGLVSSLLVPLQQLFAVIFLPESFNAEKGMALAMCLWGFTSYFYGEYKEKYDNNNQPAEKEVDEAVNCTLEK